jgi:flagella basal body P-ring formation protein FlgA
MATISEGQVIRVGDFQLPVVIDKHDEVTLIVKKGSFVISMAGRALEAGRVGQVIKVRPHNRKNELVGRIETTGIITVLDKT